MLSSFPRCVVCFPEKGGGKTKKVCVKLRFRNQGFHP